MMMNNNKKYNGIARTERIETFSDGVFAIAITLLILGVSDSVLKSENIKNTELLAYIISLWPKVLSYVISFGVIGIFWVGHHIMFGYIKRSDRVLMWLNIILLLIIAFIPFPAALMGEHGREQAAIILYGATLLLAGLAFVAVWKYASHNHRLIDQNVDPHLVRLGTKVILVAPVVYAIAIIASFINPLMSLVIYILVPILYILPGPIDTLVNNISEK